MSGGSKGAIAPELEKLCSSLLNLERMPFIHIDFARRTCPTEEDAAKKIFEILINYTKFGVLKILFLTNAFISTYKNHDYDRNDNW